MHVLVVDDRQEGLRRVRSILEAAGHRVSGAGDGETALDRLSVKPQLVLVRVTEPGTTALDLVRRMRADGLARVPVIFLTAGEPLPPSLAAHGARDCLVEPYEAETLLAAVGAAASDGVTPGARAVPPAQGRVVQIVPSGIGPLDALSGGLPCAHAYYVSGEVGTGKAVFAIQFLHHELTRGKGAILVTTERPGMILDLAGGVGLDLTPFLLGGQLALLELAGPADRLMETPDDYRLLAVELGRYADEVQATRLAIGSVLTVLSCNGRLVLTATTVSTFVRGLEELGLTTLLLGDDPATAEERLADTLLRRSAFGSFRLSWLDGAREARVITAERVLWAGPDAAVTRRYRIAPGTGIVDALDASTLAELSAHIRDAVSRAAPAKPAALVHDDVGGMRIPEAWALTFRDCVSEALRSQERCAILVAQLGGDPATPAPDEIAEALAPLWNPRHVPCWLGEQELVVFGLGSDRSAMEALAEQIRRRIEQVAGNRDRGALSVRCAVATFAHGRGAKGAVESLRAVAPRARAVAKE
jgi:CheY-like chemotaxis protein/KaiC/GvpD/RAD55 family RecA-like ATPase